MGAMLMTGRWRTTLAGYVVGPWERAETCVFMVVALTLTPRLDSAHKFRDT